MANALLYYLIVPCSHRRHYRSFAWHASMAPQDDAFKVQVWPTSDSVGSDCTHVFDKREIEIP